MNVKFILGIYFIGVVLRFEIKIYRCYCIYVIMSEMNGGVLVRLKKILSAITSLALSATVFTGVNLNVKADAAQSNWKFDFGAGGVASGYTGVSASDGYNSGRGYGFNQTWNMANVSASGSGALSDAVQFKSTDEANTFNVDLDKGLYQVTIQLGNTMRTSIKAENMLQVINMTGNNAYHTFQIPVTDGQLNIMATEGKAGYAFTMSSLEIKQISTNPAMKPTIWLCGDSTVCNYYPLDTSAQGGWGQMLNQFVDTSKFEIRNMAASGQFAKGFVDAGQFKPIEYYGKEGDFYIISIGINDTNYSNADEYYTVVTDMVKRAKAKGMTVILVKQQGRNGDATRNPLLTGRWFGGQLDTIGKEQNVQVVDLFNLWQNYCISAGTSVTDSMYMTGDSLHPNRKGAIKLAELVAGEIDFENVQLAEGAVMKENVKYTFKNVNSGLYLEVADGAAAAGTNVQQGAASQAEAKNTWQLKADSNGYYYIYSTLGDGKTYLLDLDYGKTDNGTNIGIYTNTNASAQLFKFSKNSDGSYVILTKNSKDRSCVEVGSAKTENGANIQQWEVNGHKCQSWIVEEVTEQTTQPPTEEAGKLIYGDVNCDESVDIADAVITKLYMINPSKYNLSKQGIKNADVHNVGNGINAQDALAIQSYVISRIDTLPVGERVYQTMYPAKDAAISGGITETVNAGYTEDCYVNLNNEIGSNITFNVEAGQTGNYYVAIRNANASTNDRKMKIEVNGASEYWVQSFLPTGDWTTWVETGIVLPLVAGMNTIKMTSLMSEGAPNLDYLRIELTDEPIAETYDPSSENITPTGNSTIYIAGDSTVQSYRESYKPQQGWGYYLQNYLNDVTVSNQAIAGRSSKSFVDNGRLDTILNTIKEGDYLMVQFAINDADYTKTERYAPVCGKVQNPDNGSFEYYIAKYIEGAKSKGATPILVTTVIGLKAYSNGKFVGSYTDYCQAMKNMASYYNIPCIDLNSLMVNHYNSIGYDAAYKYHLCGAVEGSTDKTHFTETGANAVAGLVANALKGLNLPVSQKVK